MELFSIFGSILLKDNNTKGKLKDIESAGHSTGSALDDVFSKVGNTLLKIGSLVGVSLGFKALFDKAEDAQKTMAQMDAVLKSTGDASGMTKKQLIDLADAQSKVTTYSKGTTEQAENMLLTFTNIKGNVFPQTITAAQDMATALGMNLTDASKTLGIALNDPAKGLTRLTRQGVTFTAAQKAQITAMEKAGNVAGAQKIILQELEKEFGGSATAAGKTFAGQLAILQNHLIGVGIGIVSKLLPPLNSLFSNINSHMPQIQSAIGNVTNFIGSAITALMPTIQGIIEDGVKIAGSIFPSISTSAGGLGTIIGGLVGGALNTLKIVLDWMAQHGTVVEGAFIGITTAVVGYKAVVMASNAVQEVQSALFAVQAIRGKFAAEALDAMKVSTDSNTVAQWLLNAAMDANPIGIVVVAIAGLITVLVLAYQHSETFRNIVNSAFNSIKTVAVNVFNFLKSFISKWGTDILAAVFPFIGIPVLIVQHWSQIKSFFSNLGNSIKSIWNSIKSTTVSVWNAIKSAIMVVISPIVTGVINLFNNMKTGISSIFEGIKSYFTGIWEVIKTIFLGAILLIIDLVTGNFTKMGSDAKGIFNDLKSAFSDIWNGIKEIFTGVLEVIKGYWTTVWNGISSVGHSIWSGLSSFFTGAWNGIKSTFISVWNGVVSFFEGLPGRFMSAAEGIGNAIKNGFNSAIQFITSLPGKALGWGKDFIDGLKNGIMSGISGIVSAVSNVANSIRSILHFSVPDEGPLIDYESWMPDFMGGLAKGIQDKKHLVTNAVKGLATDMKVGMKLDPDVQANLSNIATSNLSSTNNTNDPNQPVYIIVNMDNREVARGVYPYVSNKMVLDMKRR